MKKSRFQVRHPFTLMELVLVASCSALLFLMIVQTHAGDARTAQQELCADNLRTCGAALASYAADNADEPPVICDQRSLEKGWCFDNAFVTYLKLPRCHSGNVTKKRTENNVLNCPACPPEERCYKQALSYSANMELCLLDKEGKPRRLSNGCVEGGKLSSIPLPGQYLFLVETKGDNYTITNWKAKRGSKDDITRYSHPDNGFNVVFADGHADSGNGHLNDLPDYNGNTFWVKELQ